MKTAPFLSFPLHLSTISLFGGIIGICLQEHGLIPWNFLTPLSFPGGAILITCSLKNSEKFFWKFFLGFFFCGLSLALLYKRQQESLSFETLNFSKEILFMIEENETTANQHWPYRLCLRPLNKNKSLYLYTKNQTNFLPDDIIESEEFKIKPSNSKDFQNFLLRQNIIGTAFEPTYKGTLKRRPIFSIKRWLREKRNTLTFNLQKKLSPPVFALFCSLFLGKTVINKPLSEIYKPLFKTWGIVHHLARSGLHLTLFVLFWHLFLSCLPLPFWFKHCLLLLLCSVYFFLSFSSISFIRACHIFLLYGLCALFGFGTNALQILTLSCLATLFYNPLHLFFLDFQLSFYLTFCLLWLNHLNKQRKFFY